jgi:hypothetical protein
MTSPQEDLVTLRTDGQLRLLFSRVPRPRFSPRERGSIAFVASLLPTRVVVKNGASLNVQEIVVLNKRHEQSYTYVARLIPGVAVSRLRGGSVRMAISIAAKLLMAKALRRRVIFFHECCWPVFDLLISVIRPAGLFWPQVTMDMFQAITAADLPKPVALGHKVKQRLFTLFVNRFVIYRAPKDSGADGYNYLFAFRRYPDAIRTVPIDQRVSRASPLPGTQPRVACAPADEYQVVLIGGREPVADEYLRGIYRRLIGIAQAEGYKVFLKDHPIHSLNVRCDSCVTIDPAMPVELVEQRFAFSIGASSTALFGIGDRKLSILNLLDTMPADVKRHKRDCLFSQFDRDAERIEFLSSLEDIQRILREYRSKARPVGYSTVGASSASDT